MWYSRFQSVVVIALALECAPTLMAGDSAAMPGCPPPGKIDTFAQDTWLRRNKYPLGIKVIETKGKGGENVPVTLSVACGEADYAAGQLTPVLDGKLAARAGGRVGHLAGR